MFKAKAEVYPVVHVWDMNQAIEQTGVAFEAGADGVYLIDHGMKRRSWDDRYPLAGVFSTVEQTYPGKFIGVNFLGAGSVDGALELMRELRDAELLSRMPDGLWVDDAFGRPGLGGRWTNRMLHPMQRAAELRRKDPELAGIRLLGGVAFKYTSTEGADPDTAAWLATVAAPYMDVVTTSGSGTGHAPSEDKVREMKRALGKGGRLAVASGVDPDNVAMFRRHVDEILVASGVETESMSGIFEVGELKELIRVAHGGKPNPNRERPVRPVRRVRKSTFGTSTSTAAVEDDFDLWTDEELAKWEALLGDQNDK